MRAIVENRARCLSCGIELVSRHRHDYRECLCGSLSVDGGVDYLARGYRDEDGFEELSVWVVVPCDRCGRTEDEWWCDCRLNGEHRDELPERPIEQGGDDDGVS
jgi:hypothetical protein